MLEPQNDGNLTTKLLIEDFDFEALRIEAIYAENTAADTGNMLRLAIKHNLLVTGGTDFHGSIKPDIQIGSGKGNFKVEYDVLDKLKAIISTI